MPHDVWAQAVIRVRIGEKGRHRQQHLRRRQRRSPLIAQNVQANATVVINVWMINFRQKRNAWRLERIVRREMHVKVESTTFERRPLRTEQDSSPVEHVALTDGVRRHVAALSVAGQLFQLFADASQSHLQFENQVRRV